MSRIAQFPPSRRSPSSRTVTGLLLAGSLAALLGAAASPAFAGGDIVKCVGVDGHVTLTDGQCSSGVPQVIVPAALNTAPDQAGQMQAAPAQATTDAPVRPARAGLQKVALVVEPVQHDNWIDHRPRARMFDRDAATLRAARTSMQALDEARTQRVAVN